MSARKKVIIVFIGFFVVGASLVVWRRVIAQSHGRGTVLSLIDIADRLNNPLQSTAQIKALRSLNIHSTPLIVSNDIPIKLHTLQLRLPAGYNVRPDETDPDHISRLAASTRRDGYRQLVVLTEERPSIDDLPAVQMRRRSPKLYREEKISVAGVPGIAFISATAEHYEKVVFVQRGVFITSFAISADLVFVAQLAEQNMAAILGGIEWSS